MKYKFNESTLVVGHIKELLHSFNLPTIQVYTDDTVLYKDRSYIKDNKIVKWTGEEFEFLADYIYNYPLVNLTKTLEMNSSIYDSYTHEYLGDYLRFLRDYHKLNLMGMYNCFGGKRPSRIYYSQKIDDSFVLEINTDDVNYNYYIVPIKFNKTYTIAIDSEIKWELVSLIYSNIFVSNVPESLIKESYKTVNGSKFTNPFTYSTYFSSAEQCWSKEKNLVLLFKLPKEIKSSIVVLEGDFTSCTNVVDGTLVNKIITDDSAKNESIQLNLKNSLLEANLNESYPFADRLVEYILENAITLKDVFQKNIGRVQESVYKDSIKGYYGIWDDQLTNNIYDLMLKPDITKGESKKYGNTILMYDNINSYKDKSHVVSFKNPKRWYDEFVENLTSEERE